MKFGDMSPSFRTHIMDGLAGQIKATLNAQCLGGGNQPQFMLLVFDGSIAEFVSPTPPKNFAAKLREVASRLDEDTVGHVLIEPVSPATTYIKREPVKAWQYLPNSPIRLADAPTWLGRMWRAGDCLEVEDLRAPPIFFMLNPSDWLIRRSSDGKTQQLTDAEFKQSCEPAPEAT